VKQVYLQGQGHNTVNRFVNIFTIIDSYSN